jgi:hypothetical protein
MKLIPLFCVLSAATCVLGQTQAPVEASASANPAGGGATITVRNHYASPLLAFVFIYTLRDADATVYSASTGSYDSAIDPLQNHPVPPGEEVKLPYYAGNRGMVPVVNIEAALFADGTTFGHKNMVQTIFERRNYALVTLNKSIAELKQAGKQPLSREQLAGQMQSAMNQERMAAGNNDLAACILTIRNQVFLDLMNARDPASGAPLPLDKFLPAEIETLTHRREALLAK